MARVLVLLMSAVVATSAEAQQDAAHASSSEETASHAMPEGADGPGAPPIMVASTTTPQSQPSSQSPSGPASKPSGSGDEDASLQDATAAIRRAFVRLMLTDTKFEARCYQQTLPHTTDSRTADTTITCAARIGREYYIQVRSRSDEPWILQHARVAGRNGEMLKVYDVRSQPTGKGWYFNAIVLEVPESAGSDYLLTRLELVGQDGRVAVQEEVLLP